MVVRSAAACQEPRGPYCVRHIHAAILPEDICKSKNLVAGSHRIGTITQIAQQQSRKLAIEPDMSRAAVREWPLPSARPEDVGMCSARLARIRPTLQKFIDQQRVPHLVTLVARHGKIVHFDAQGYIDPEGQTAASEDTIFRLFSNTKPITGVAIMILFEEGLLSLDDPVSKYVPAFKDLRVRVSDSIEDATINPLSMIRTVPALRPITIRDCLRNTTGLAMPHRVPISIMRESGDATEAWR